MTSKSCEKQSNNFRKEMMDTFIASLEGSCNTLASMCAQANINEDDLTMDELRYLDDNIALCEDCNWWCAIDELHESDNGLICGDCKS